MNNMNSALPDQSVLTDSDWIKEIDCLVKARRVKRIKTRRKKEKRKIRKKQRIVKKRRR